MIRGLYAAASGMKALSIQQDVTARNLAHANKPGFRRQILTFESFVKRDAHLGVQVERVNDFTVGDPQFTQRELDVALTGDGFFVLDGPNGPLYTRSGVFQVNAQGQLITMDGFPVQGVAGPITAPPLTEHFSILDNGIVLADGQQVGQLRIVQFTDNNRLTRAGNTLFRAPNDLPPQPSPTEVRQGYRERSNGPMVLEMVNMIDGLRHYEAAQKALTSLSDVIQLSTRPQG